VVPQQLVVVGASLAGLGAVRGARRLGFDGRITLVGAEPHLPYDRPPLSKEFLESDEPRKVPTLCDAEVLSDQLSTELLLGTPASELRPDEHTVRAGDQLLEYDKLIIATGSSPCVPPDMPGAHVLRTIDDALAIRDALRHARHVTVVGAGFIGSEVASSARKRGCDVTVVEAAQTPLSRALGTSMGAACSTLHEVHGVDVRCGVTVAATEEAARVVHLSDGSVLRTDLVVLGTGAKPATDWLGGSALRLDDGVVCDAMLGSSAPDVYAAGDVARWFNRWSGNSMRLEHWTAAAEQGEAAARNAVAPEDGEPYAAVPYFWSDAYGTRIQFLGVPDCDQVEVVSGDPRRHKFVTLYRSGDRLTGALGMDNQVEVLKYRRLLKKGASWTDALAFAESRRAARAGAS
jgi:NADPH-dependent 2,4-dienoyl-CoA reductase/sulfur reductase-like enzyme